MKKETPLPVRVIFHLNFAVIVLALTCIGYTTYAAFNNPVDAQADRSGLIVGIALRYIVVSGLGLFFLKRKQHQAFQMTMVVSSILIFSQKGLPIVELVSLFLAKLKSTEHYMKKEERTM